MPRLLKTEQPHQRRIFEQFFALGDGRSLPRLAAETGIKAQTLKLWSRSFGWRSRIAERDTEVVRQASERSMSDAVAEIELNLKIVRMSKRRLSKDIAEGKAKGTYGDLVKLIQLERELLSRPDPTAPADGGHSWPGPVIYLPDNGRGRPPGPVVILPDNGTDPDFAPIVALPDDGSGDETLSPATPLPQAP